MTKPDSGEALEAGWTLGTSPAKGGLAGGRRALATDATALGLSSLAAAALQLALQVVVARSVSLEAFGAYAAAAAYASTLEMVLTARSGELGLQFAGKAMVLGDGPGLRAALRRLRRDDYLVFAWSWTLFGVGVVMLARPLRLDAWLTIALACSLPLQAGYGVSKAILTAAGAIVSLARFEAAFWSVQFALAAAGALAFGLYGVAAGVLLSNVFKTWYARRLAGPMIGTPVDLSLERAASDALSRQPLRLYGVLALARNSLNVAWSNLDVALLNLLAGREMVAVYRVARSLSQIPGRFMGPVWGALRPRLMDAWQRGDRRRALWLVVRPAAWLVPGLLVGLGITALFGRQVITALYGAAYAAALTPLLILLAGTIVFQGLTGWFGFWVVIAEERGRSLLVYGALLTLTVVAAIALVPLTPEGMAVAVASASVVAALLSWALLLRTSLRHENVDRDGRTPG